MQEMRQNAAMMRGEQALYKEQRLKVNRSAPHYRIEGDDVLLLSGPYANWSVRLLWAADAQGRDYIYQYIYPIKDLEVQRIVKECFCL